MKTVPAAILAASIASAAYGVHLNSRPMDHVEPAADRQVGDPGAALLAERQWIGRAVRSSDGRYLGDVAGVNEDNPLELYVDIADFLAPRREAHQPFIGSASFYRISLRK
jgi:hypothetical protein